MLSQLFKRPIYRRISSFTFGLILPFVVLCALVLPVATSSQTQDQQGPDRPPKRERPVSLLVEEGNLLPSQPLVSFYGARVLDGDSRFILDANLVDWSAGFSPNTTFDVTFTILQGEARFESPEKTTTATPMTDGAIKTPTITPGLVYDESIVSVLVNGQVITDAFRVATLPVGGIENLKKYLADNPGALINSGDHYAVVDENMITSISDEGTQGAPSARVNSAENASQTTSSCIRSPRGPGRVIWNIRSPKLKGYSVRLEDPVPPQALVWAKRPSQGIDGIYRASWGCGAALKVPNSCDVTVNPDGYTYCCNAALAALGYVPTCVAPGRSGTQEQYWAPCPLQ